MPKIHLSATGKTPAVLFDPAQGLMELRGCCIPENADAFWRPLIQEVEAYVKQPAKRTIVRLTLDYFNSSSSKYILDLLKVLDEVQAAGTGAVLLEWHHAQDDLDMREAGQDYKALLEMPVKLVAD